MGNKAPSQQKLLYQQAWLKAYRQEGGLMLNFKSRSGAFEARRHLYECVREVKADPLLDPSLFKAAEAIQIVWAGETSLHMRHRNTNDATQGLEEALGMSVEQVQDEGMLESAERMMRELGMGGDAVESVPSDAKLTAPQHLDNPFYGKRS